MKWSEWKWDNSRKDEIVIYCSIVSKSGIQYTINEDEVQAWVFSDKLPAYHKN